MLTATRALLYHGDMIDQWKQTDLNAIKAKVDEWLSVDPNEKSREEIRGLVADANWGVLANKLLQRISFGTAGLRSSMELGFSHMNDVTVLQASQGIVAYLLNSAPASGLSIVVGYDHRYHSQRFAELTASVALSKGLDVYYLGDCERLSPELDSLHSDYDYFKTVHTPMVPFTINHLGASAGVMVTASHNPAKDNGYKVYYGNGCQIIPPHDLGIARSIDANLAPWKEHKVWDVKGNFQCGIASGKLHVVHDAMTNAYIEEIQEQLITSGAKITLPFVYTPIHGVGLSIFEKICKNFGGSSVKYIEVTEQINPDPDFPSVRFPNPEEAGTLDLAIAQAQAVGARFVFANDPDADRFSAAVQCRDQSWRQLTGNEIGALFAAYIFELVKMGRSLGTNSDPVALKDMYFLNSTVSSQLIKAMAEKEGFKYEETLTGFKWIGNKALDLKKRGYSVPFGYEEATGYMFSLVDDKDGISAAVVFLQLCQHWFADGAQYPEEKLSQIYEKYGWCKECNGYYKLDDVLKIDNIFKCIRDSYGKSSSGSDASHFPERISDLEVVAWRDLNVGYDSTTSDNLPILPTDSSSQMITATVTDLKGRFCRFTCRGSGTEPKLKVYIEATSTESESDAVEFARHCWNILQNEWFDTEKFGLEVVV